MPVKDVDEYIAKHERWSSELKTLRKMVLGTGLQEQIKWGGPVYTWKGKNVLSIGAFKNHYALWFFHGVLLSNDLGLLEEPTNPQTQTLRQIRFTDNSKPELPALRSYVMEAIHNEEEGIKWKPEDKPKLEIPAFLANALREDKNFETAFKKLTEGRQRDYAHYIASAKRESTRESRLNKIIPLILAGQGLNDKYRP